MLAPTPQRCYFQTCILSLQQARLSRTTTVDQALGSRTVAMYQSQSTGKFIDGLRMYATRQKTFRCCKALQLDGSYKHASRSKAKLLVSNAARNDVANTHKIAQQLMDQIERKLHRMLRHSEGLGRSFCTLGTGPVLSGFDSVDQRWTNSAACGQLQTLGHIFTVCMVALHSVINLTFSHWQHHVHLHEW